MKQPGKLSISFRWLCFGLLLVAAVCRLLSRGMLLPEAEAAQMQETAEEAYPAFLYSLPEIPSLQFTPEEAALALGRPVKTIHTQLARGKKLLREQLERRDVHGTLSP